MFKNLKMNVKRKTNTETEFVRDNGNEIRTEHCLIPATIPSAEYMNTDDMRLRVSQPGDISAESTANSSKLI